MDSQRTAVAFTTELRGWSAEEVANAAKQAQATLDSPGWGVLERLIGQRRDKVQAQLVDGVLSHVDYAWRGGVLRGLNEAENALRTVIAVSGEVREALEQEAAKAAREGS